MFLPIILCFYILKYVFLKEVPSVYELVYRVCKLKDEMLKNVSYLSLFLSIVIFIQHIQNCFDTNTFKSCNEDTPAQICF